MSVQIIQGDCLEVLRRLPDSSIHCCITSPPYYGLRDYGIVGQLGLERTPEEYVAKFVAVFQEVKRVLRADGTLWLNLGDSYYNYRPGGDALTKQTFANNTGAVVQSCPRRNFKQIGLKEKDLIGIPWRVAFALQADGWYLRQDIIWAKPNPMPESVRDRCTKSHEYVFMLSKKARYYYDAEAISEPSIHANEIVMNRRGINNRLGGTYGQTRQGFFKAEGVLVAEIRNKRSVWTTPVRPLGGGVHFAVFPPELITPMILAGCPEGGTVLDPFAGSGTTGMVAENLGRNSILIELNPKYVELAKERTKQTGIQMKEVPNADHNED